MSIDKIILKRQFAPESPKKKEEEREQQLKLLSTAIMEEDADSVGLYLTPETVNAILILPKNEVSNLARTFNTPLLYGIFKRNLKIVRKVVEMGGTITEEALRRASILCFHRVCNNKYASPASKDKAKASKTLLRFLLNKTQNYHFSIHGKDFKGAGNALDYFLFHDPDDLFTEFLDNDAPFDDTILSKLLQEDNKPLFLKLFNQFEKRNDLPPASAASSAAASSSSAAASSTLVTETFKLPYKRLLFKICTIKNKNNVDTKEKSEFLADIAKRLLAKGIDPNQRPLPPFHDRSYLHRALSSGRREIAELLLAANANMENEDPTTLLHAIKNHYDAIVKQMLAKKPNLDIHMQMEWTFPTFQTIDTSTTSAAASSSSAASASSASSAASAAAAPSYSKRRLPLFTPAPPITSALGFAETVTVYPLSLAVLIGDFALIRLLMQEAVTERDIELAILMAAKNNSIHTLELLLAFRASQPLEHRATDWHQPESSPLAEALRYRNYPMAEKLINGNWYVNHSDNNGNTALGSAAFHASTDYWPHTTIVTLLNKGADPNTRIFRIVSEHEDERNIMGYAVHANDEVLIKLLLKLSTFDERKKQFALYTAANLDRLPLLKLILENTQNIPWNFSDGLLNPVSPLIKAIKLGRTECARALIAAHRDLHGTDPHEHQEGPLFYAIRFARREIVELLLRADSVAVTTPNANGVFPLHVASSYIANCRNGDILKLIIEKTPDINITDNEGRNALMYSLRDQQNFNAELLINAGINIQARSKTGEHALFSLLKNIKHIYINQIKLSENFVLDFFRGMTTTFWLILSKGSFIEGEWQVSPHVTATTQTLIEELKTTLQWLDEESPVLQPTGTYAINPNSRRIWSTLASFQQAKVHITTMLNTLVNSNDLHHYLKQDNQTALAGFRADQLMPNSNVRCITDGKTQLHLALLKQNTLLAGKMLDAGADVRLAGFDKTAPIDIMSTQLKAIWKLYQEYLPEIYKIYCTLEPTDFILPNTVATAASVASTASSAASSASSASSSSAASAIAQTATATTMAIDDKVKKEQETALVTKMIQLGNQCLETLKSTYNDKENEEALCQIRADICFKVSSYFFHPDKVRPWYNLEIANSVLSQISKKSHYFQTAQTYLLLIKLHTGEEQSLSLDGEETRNKLLLFLNSFQFLDTTLCAEHHKEIKDGLFSKYLAHYIFEQNSIRGIPNVDGLNQNSLMAIFDTMRSQFKEKEEQLKEKDEQHQREVDNLAKQLAKAKARIAELTAAPASSSSTDTSTGLAVSHDMAASNGVVALPSTAFAASAASTPTAAYTPSSAAAVSTQPASSSSSSSSSSIPPVLFQHSAQTAISTATVESTTTAVNATSASTATADPTTNIHKRKAMTNSEVAISTAAAAVETIDEGPATKKVRGN